MKIFPTLLALFVLTNPAWGQNFDSEAQSAFWAAWAFEYSPEGSPDYQKAAALYEQAAAAGSREALLALARLSAPHGPLWKDGARWRDRLLAAARAGWPEAAFTLAQALEKKEIVPFPELNAAEFYVQAAAAGHGPAALRLGEMCLAGNAAFNIARDDKQAAIWFTVAAENHEEAAALALGKIFFEKNTPVAARWLEGVKLPEAAYLLGEIRLKEGRFIEAVNSFTVAADQGYAPAHLSLGLLNLDNDFGRRPDEREALRHFKIAAQADLPEASYQLAHMYINGQATPKDGISGAFWLNRAAEKGHAAAKAEYDKLIYNFSIGQKKRLERMIEEGITPTMQTTVQ